jgi:four helix bundle protein
MTFENLDCWQKARELARGIYRTSRREELRRDFGLCGQIQRAGVSAMSNIAEGFERQHVPEKLQFYNVAHGSIAEVRSLTYVIEDNYPSVAAEALRLREQSREAGKLIAGLVRSTASRKGRLADLLSSFLHLLFPV